MSLWRGVQLGGICEEHLVVGIRVWLHLEDVQECDGVLPSDSGPKVSTAKRLKGHAWV